MNNEEIIELAGDWFDSISKITTRRDISDEEKLLRIRATCQRCENFLNKRKQKDDSEDNMNNEKKASAIGIFIRDLCVSKGINRDTAEIASTLCQQSALEMAEWKDKQYKALRELVIDFINNSQCDEMSEEIMNAEDEWCEHNCTNEGFNEKCLMRWLDIKLRE